MITKIKTTGMSREEWLEERRKSIGGSDLGAILGLNKWSSPYAVWANKTGRVPDAEPNEAMRQGTDLEDYVAQRFMEKSGLKVGRENAILRNSDYPHMHANIDRRIVGMRAGLECKTASALSASRFSGGDFPESYYAQCVAYMAITGYDTYYLAALVLGKEFKVYQMTTDPHAEAPEWCDSSVYVGPEEFRGIRDAVSEFWEYVETDTEPPVDMSAATADTIAAIYPESNGESVDLFGLDDTFAAYLAAKARLEGDKKAVELYSNLIKQRLGEAESGSCGSYTASWKTQHRDTFDVKAFRAEHPNVDLSPYFKTSTFRKFTVKEISA